VRERIWQRPNPVDVGLFHPATKTEKQAARARFLVREGVSVQLVFGRFTPRKNQRFAVRVLSHLPPSYHLLLAGPAFAEDGDYLAAVRCDIEALNLQGRVTVHAQAVADAPSVYHAADQLWLTSTREGLPNVMLEALCCGLPVVINRDLRLEDYVVDGMNGREADADPSVFAAAAVSVQSLSASEEARAAIASRARSAYDADRLCVEFAQRLAAVAGMSVEAQA
jgi:glycosyltransferase involved in cell wall biosynthesis